MRFFFDAEKEKGLEIGAVGRGIGGRNHVNVHMIGHETRILEKIDTTTETVKEIEKKRGIGKEIMVVIEVEIEREKETMAGISSAALATVIVRGTTLESGRGIEIMSALAMRRIAVMLMKEMLNMIMLMWHMIGIVKVLKQGILIIIVIQTVVGSIMMAPSSTGMKMSTVNTTNRKSSSMMMRLCTTTMEIMERKVLLIIRANTNVQSLNHLRRERRPGITTMNTTVLKDPSPVNIDTDDLCFW